MDYAMLSHLQLQSSSDQEDYRLYPAIEVRESAAVLPGQLAIWSYQLASGDADAATFNMVNAMLFRIHQSGHLAELSPESLPKLKQACKSTRIRFDLTSAPPCPITRLACRT